MSTNAIAVQWSPVIVRAADLYLFYFEMIKPSLLRQTRSSVFKWYYSTSVKVNSKVLFFSQPCGELVGPPILTCAAVVAVGIQGVTLSSYYRKCHCYQVDRWYTHQLSQWNHFNDFINWCNQRWTILSGSAITTFVSISVIYLLSFFSSITNLQMFTKLFFSIIIRTSRMAIL